MSTLNFAKVHNMIAFLSKHTESAGFKQIIEFLNAHPIKYALIVNPTIYNSCVEQFWVTAKVKNINGEALLHAKVDGKNVVISKVSIRRDLQFRDIGGIDCLPNETICAQLSLMGMVKNLDSATKLLRFPRFVQVFLNNQHEEMDNYTRIYVLPSHTKKIFRNMKRVGNGFSRRDTPLFPTMMVQAQEEMEIVVDEVVNEEMHESLERATTIATSLDAEQDRGNISKTQSKATPNEPSSPRTSSGGGPKRQDTIGIPLRRLGMRMYLNFIMAKLSQETAQAQEIKSLKKRVKRLEKNKRDKDIFGVNDQDDTSMFDADKDLQCEEVVVEEVNVASIATATTTTISMDEITLAKALIEINTSRPKAKGLDMQESSETPRPLPIISSQQPLKVQDKERLHAEEQEQFTNANKAKLFMEFMEKRRKFFAAKRAEKREINLQPKLNKEVYVYLSKEHGWMKDKSFEEQVI
uniref:Xylulose kinase-1 n=1 Tax=Tanacetum cinerariifolium TaxID=118510 RepID=A0A699IUM0_TANCI|nr:hypothetical protein [Tanacetum cinerariifolium]